MTVDQVDRTVTTETPPTTTGQSIVQTETSHRASTGPSGQEFIRRIVVLVFGLIQLIIALRFVLLLLNAREANGLVSGVLNISQVFVGPFEGILGTDSLHAAGAVVDITAIVAFVGWTIVELVVLWAIGIFRREPA